MHDAQAVGEIQGAGEGEGGVFPQAQARGGDDAGLDIGLRLPQRGQRRQAGDEDGGLADGGGVEPFGRAVGADGEEVVTEDGGGVGEELPRRREAVTQAAGHSDRLGTLAGEQERGFGHGTTPAKRMKDEG